jgi:hypothetical protein
MTFTLGTDGGEMWPGVDRDVTVGQAVCAVYEVSVVGQ